VPNNFEPELPYDQTMFNPLIASPSRCGFVNRVSSLKKRDFSLVSVHRTFPATLYRFQLQRASMLYDKTLQGNDQAFEDAVEVSRDGLVRPGIIGDGAQILLLGIPL
jgi:hypothetical protein